MDFISYIIQSVLLSQKFITSNYNDISDIVAFKNDHPKLITAEEEYKLLLFKKPPKHTNRTELEKAFWTAEDLKFCNGKIGHLLELPFHQDEPKKFNIQSPSIWEGNYKFELNKFISIYNSYCEICENVIDVWGDLFPTDMYVEQNDRITEGCYWSKNSSFLRLVLSRNQCPDISLLDFAISMEKGFISKYNMNQDEIRKESSSKKQLYLYYILHNRILNNWEWNNKWNFGAYDGSNYPDYKSIFENNKIYQFYGSQLRYNVGYDSGSGIPVQNTFDKKRDYIKELIQWSIL